MSDSSSLEELSSKSEMIFWAVSFFGSEQEFDKKPISRGFPENDKFSLGGGHTLSLEEQIA